MPLLARRIKSRAGVFFGQMSPTPGQWAFALGALVGVAAVLLEEGTPLTAPVLTPAILLALLAIIIVLGRREVR